MVDTMIWRKISILCLQETKWVGEKTKTLEASGFKLWCTGKSKTKNGVGIVVNSLLCDAVVEVFRKGDRIIALKIVVGNKLVLYAPHVELDEANNKGFFEDLDEI